MPHSVSAKKRLRQNLRSRERNRAIKSEIKSEMRKLFDALTSGDIPAAREHFRLVAKKTDRAAAKRTIHPNRAARIKSRLSARVLAVSKGGAAVSTPTKKTGKAKA
ncbi:MAG: 30S ribosomal protein S20 [Planctomycetia bacterium]|jgi:small subunit ribosomal protein S20|nr:30S ribosomal protein S20 [Planctomycetia bacterium]